VTRIRRKFWIDSRGARWVVYVAGSQLVAITREELEALEVA
jgi:hypothetical protein